LTDLIETDFEALEEAIRKEFKSIFEPLPHIKELPCELVTCINLKDNNVQLKMQNYPCP